MVGLLRHLCAAAYYGLLGWHAWSRRHRISQLGQFFSSAVVKPPAVKDNDEDALDRWADRQMDEFRVQSTHAILEALSIATAMVLMVIFAGNTSLPQADANALALIGSLVYPFSLLTRHDGLVKVTPRRATILYVVLHAMLIAHVIITGDDNLYFVGGLRTLFRFCTGFMVLNARLSTAVNAAWSWVLIHEHLYKITPELSAICRTDFVIYEAITMVGMQLFLSFAESFLHSHFRLHVSMAVATNWQQAVRRLLSVLCDAELELSPALSIRDPSRKVAQLLAPDQVAPHLQGRSFTDFVAGPDLERFQSFLSCSAGSSAPASLQLHLNDSTGYSRPVEIFLASMPDLVESSRTGSHLIGIKDCGVGKEVSEAAAPLGPTFGPGCPPPPVLLPARPKPRELHDDEASSATGKRGLDLPELHVFEVSFDPLHEDMPISELRVIFKGLNEEGERLQPPLLRSWFHDCCRDRLRDWVQENCNTFAVGAEEYAATAFKQNIVLKLPPACNPTLLEVCKMSLDFQEGGQEGDQESEEEGGDGSSPEENDRSSGSEGSDGAFVGIIRMEQLRQLESKPRPRHHRANSRGSSQSSRSRRSVPMKPMQSIKED